MKLRWHWSVLLLVVLVGFGVGLHPSLAGGPDQCQDPPGTKCQAPPTAACGDKSITVYGDGLHGNDAETYICVGKMTQDGVAWQPDSSVQGFKIHFASSPFEPQTGSGDYCAGANCSGNPHDTGRRHGRPESAHANQATCYKYCITITPTNGKPPYTIDPHVIVGSTGSSQ